ncbi:cytokine receptor family member b1 [Acanthopagrus schlegelii]
MSHCSGVSLAVMQCDVRALSCRHDAGDVRRLESELHSEDFCFPSRTQRRRSAGGSKDAVYLLELHEDRRMNCLLLLLYSMSLLDSALTFLPAPVNLSVKSVNFHHVLRWDPGLGTPPGAEYRIYMVTGGDRKPKRLAKTKRSSVQLILKEPLRRYYLAVQASYNRSVSELSASKEFIPFRDTEIGAPKLSLAGYGNGILINISLPEPDRNSGVSDIHSYCIDMYKIWVKRRDKEEKQHFTTRNSYNLSNLQTGEEYCIQVRPDSAVNSHTEPSAWECTFTSIVGPNRAPVIVGSVASLVIIFIGVGMASTYLLYYTGFICKLKATLPRALIAALSGGYTLTPERTVPDQISIIPEKQRKQNNPTTPKPASRHANSEEKDEEDEEGEEDGLNVYMDRPTDLSSDQSSSQDSGVASGSRTLEVVVPEVQVVHEELEEDETKAGGAAKVCFIPEETGARERITGEEEEEEVCHSSGNVDLFSITLAALAVHEEEEEEEEECMRDSPTNIFRPYQQPEAPADSELDDQTAVAVTLPAQEDFTGYEVKRLDAFSDFFKTCEGETQEEEEEEEEEEEFSGYMRHS